MTAMLFMMPGRNMPACNMPAPPAIPPMDVTNGDNNPTGDKNDSNPGKSDGNVE